MNSKNISKSKLTKKNGKKKLLPKNFNMTLTDLSDIREVKKNEKTKNVFCLVNEDEKISN